MLLGSGGNRFWESAALTGLGRAAVADNDAAAARRALTDALEIGRSLGGWPLLRGWLEGCALLARAERQPRAALMLAGVASLVEDRPGAGMPIVLPGLGEQWLNSTRAAVGPSADAVWAEGRSLSPRDTMQSALAYAETDTPTAKRPKAGEPRLTRRERQVTQLVAQGRTNREIGRALVITEGTARVHVERVLGKLGLRSRAQLAAWAVSQSAALDGQLDSEDTPR